MAVIYMPGPLQNPGQEMLDRFKQLVNQNDQRRMMEYQDQLSQRREERDYNMFTGKESFLDGLLQKKEKRGEERQKAAEERGFENYKKQKIFDYEKQRELEEYKKKKDQEEFTQVAELYSQIPEEDRANPIKVVESLKNSNPEKAQIFMDFAMKQQEANRKAQAGLSANSLTPNELAKLTTMKDPKERAAVIMGSNLPMKDKISLMKTLNAADLNTRKEFEGGAKYINSQLRNSKDLNESSFLGERAYANLAKGVNPAEAWKIAVNQLEEKKSIEDSLSKPSLFESDAKKRTKEEKLKQGLRKGYFSDTEAANLYVSSLGKTPEEAEDFLNKNSPNRKMQLEYNKEQAKDAPTLNRLELATTPKEQEEIKKEAVKKFDNLPTDAVMNLYVQAEGSIPGFSEKSDKEQDEILLQYAIQQGLV